MLFRRIQSAILPNPKIPLLKPPGPKFWKERWRFWVFVVGVMETGGYAPELDIPQAAEPSSQDCLL